MNFFAILLSNTGNTIECLFELFQEKSKKEFSPSKHDDTWSDDSFLLTAMSEDEKKSDSSPKKGMI